MQWVLMAAATVSVLMASFCARMILVIARTPIEKLRAEVSSREQAAKAAKSTATVMRKIQTSQVK